jgi:2-methylcitrate dehydratase PrpD
MAKSPVGAAVEEELARHFAATGPGDIPRLPAEQARRAILWWTATALEGSAEPQQKALYTYTSRQGGRTEATVLGRPARLPAELAGLVNGRAGKALEREDKYWASESIGFAIGCCVVPAAVAVAQALGGVPGSYLTMAVALAIDFEARLLSPLGLGFVPGRAAANATFALGNYGAAVAAGKVLGLDAAGFLDALGLVHGQASGNFQGQYEGRGVSIQCGYAVRNGIAAARLAHAGLTGPHAFITGAAGLYAVHYPNSDVDPESVTRALGQDYLGVNLGFKAYPCGIVAHPALDAVRSVRPLIGGRSVKAVEVDGPPSLSIMAEPIEAKRSPRTAIEAQFSIPWAIGCTIRDDALTVDHYSDELLADAELRRLAETVTVRLRPEIQGSTVRIVLSDGSVLQTEPVLTARGHPRNPLPTSEIAQLFQRSARRAAVPESNAGQALAMLNRLPAVPDVDDIFSLLAGPAGPLPG